jgi:hypothetical protein
VAGAVFTELSLFLILQDAEGFAKKIMANFIMDDTAIHISRPDTGAFLRSGG